MNKTKKPEKFEYFFSHSSLLTMILDIRWNPIERFDEKNKLYHRKPREKQNQTFKIGLNLYLAIVCETSFNLNQS